jgi:hypothetical protein
MWSQKHLSDTGSSISPKDFFLKERKIHLEPYMKKEAR